MIVIMIIITMGGRTAGDEGGQGESDHRAGRPKGLGGLRESEDDDARDSEPEEAEKGPASTKHIAERACEDAHDDGEGDGERARGGDVVRREVEPPVLLALLEICDEREGAGGRRAGPLRRWARMAHMA